MQNPDKAIIRRVLAGDRKAHAELVNRHKDKAFTLALRILNNREEAEEALQDAFVRAFQALPRFEGKSSFSTWLYRIVYNACLTARSKRGREVHVSVDEEGDEQGFEVPSSEPLPDVEFESAQVQAAIQGEIAKLPELYSALVTMFFLQEMSYDEIVHITGLPLGTVKVRLFRARAMLRAAIGRRLGYQRPVVAREKEIEE